MEPFIKGYVWIYVILGVVHLSSSVPLPSSNKNPEPELQPPSEVNQRKPYPDQRQFHLKQRAPYPEFRIEKKSDSPNSDPLELKFSPRKPDFTKFNLSDPESSLRRPYPHHRRPVYFNPNHYFDSGRLAAAAVHNVNLRDLFKPLLASSDSSRLTQYIDSVINRFNMRSAKPPPAKQKEIESNVQLSLDAGLEKFKQAFKIDKDEEKANLEKKTEPSASTTAPANDNLKNQVMNKTDALLERLGIINKNKEPSKETDVKKETTQTPAIETNLIQNALQTYPYDIYSNLKKLHDSSLNSPKTPQVADILKELEEVTRKNGISDISGLTYIFNDILSKYRSITSSSTNKMNAFYDILSQTQNGTIDEGNGSTKSALFEIEIPFYYPEAKMPSFKHIAGATALGALALGALFASPLGTGILRRNYEEDDDEEEGKNRMSTWLESLAFWKDKNETDPYAPEEDYDYKGFHELYNPYYQMTRDIYNQNYDYQNYYGNYHYGTPNDHYYQENTYDDKYKEDKNYERQNDKDNNRWYSSHNYYAHPYQFVTPEPQEAKVAYDATRNENTYSETAYNSRVRPALAVPLASAQPVPQASDLQTQSFNVQDSYAIHEKHENSDQTRRDEYGQTPEYVQESYDGVNRYVTVNEVNRIAEDALKQILQNYQMFLAGGEPVETEPREVLGNPGESSYSSLDSEEYSTDWKPKSNPNLLSSRASALVSNPESGSKKENSESPSVPPAPVAPSDTTGSKRGSRKRPVPLRRRKLTRQKDKGEKIDQGTGGEGDIKKEGVPSDGFQERQTYQRKEPKANES